MKNSVIVVIAMLCLRSFAADSVSPAVLKDTTYSYIRGFDLQPMWGSNGHEIWTHFDAKEYRRYLKAARKNFPRANTMRVWLSFDAWYDHPDKTIAAIRTAGELIKEEGFKMMPVYFNAWRSAPDFGGISYCSLRAGDGPKGKFYMPYGRYVEAVAKALEPLDVVVMHDICNEPMNSFVGVWHDAYHLTLWPDGVRMIRSFVAAMSECLHKVSKHPVTIGTQGEPWFGAVDGIDNDIDLFGPYLDVIACHPYTVLASRFPGYQEYLNWVIGKANAHGKPLVGNECGWDAKTEKERAEVCRKEFGALTASKIGFIAHALMPSRVADLFRHEDPTLRTELYMPFLNADGSLRAEHGFFNEF